MIGSPDTPKILVSLFDYTCPHCRLLHAILINTQRHFTNQFAVLSLPMPLSTNCNPFLPPGGYSLPNRCEYARLSLAVWRAKPEAHRQFDEWLFSPEVPLPVSRVQDYAAQLVGTNNLETALVDPWVGQQLLTDCRLYHANWMASDSDALPQLIIGDTISSGPINSVQHLLVLLNRYLGLEVNWDQMRQPVRNP
jgi:hypothetical protein